MPSSHAPGLSAASPPPTRGPGNSPVLNIKRFQCILHRPVLRCAHPLRIPESQKLMMPILNSSPDQTRPLFERERGRVLCSKLPFRPAQGLSGTRRNQPALYFLSPATLNKTQSDSCSLFVRDTPSFTDTGQGRMVCPSKSQMTA